MNMGRKWISVLLVLIMMTAGAAGMLFAQGAAG